MWGHAIDTPIRLAMPVADCDGKSTKVAPHHLDGSMKARAIAVDTRHGHVFTLAAVVCLVEGSVGTTTCKMEIKSVIKIESSD